MDKKIKVFFGRASSSRKTIDALNINILKVFISFWVCVCLRVTTQDKLDEESIVDPTNKVRATTHGIHKKNEVDMNLRLGLKPGMREDISTRWT